jgi:phage terminase large subunit-like protein
VIIQFIDKLLLLNEKGRPWSLSPYQRAVLGLAYAKPYSTRILSEPKKSGKTFLAGAIAIAEAMLNPDCEVVSAANDEEQSRSRVYATCVSLCQKNPGINSSVVKITQNEILFSNGSKIKAIASDYRGEAGGRQRLTIFDELWAYDSESATRLFEECRPPPSEPGAYILIVSYAGFVNESTVLEQLYKRAMAGKKISNRYPVYVDQGLFCFWSTTPRQPWHTKSFLDEERRNLRRNQYKRLYENQWVSAESQFISAEQYDSIVDDTLTPAISRANVYMAVDIGVKSDSTGIVAVRFNKEGDKLETAFHRAWKPTRGNPVDLTEVEDYIIEMTQRHSVQGICADPSQAYLLIQRLAKRSIVVEEFTQTQNNGVKMGETLFSMVTDKTLKVYPSPELREHVLNATAIETGSGARMSKAKQSKKIDLAIALAMACVTALARGNGPDLVETLATVTSAEQEELNQFLTGDDIFQEFELGG